MVLIKYIAAYVLLILGGNNSPIEDDVIVEPVHVDIKNVVNILKGKNLNDIIKEGQKQLKSLSIGGSSQSSAPASEATSAAQTAQASKTEPPKKAEEPEEDVDMGGLFD